MSVIEYTDPAKWEIVLTGDPTISKGDRFQHLGCEYVAVTNAVGHFTVVLGISVSDGMAHDPLNPLPVGAVTAVRV